jgi:hypothetical protein
MSVAALVPGDVGHRRDDAGHAPLFASIWEDAFARPSLSLAINRFRRMEQREE